MKNTLLLLILLTMGLASLSYARTSVSVGFFGGAPVHSRPVVVRQTVTPAVVTTTYPAWYYAPATNVYVEGRLHRMHYYAGAWYDEMDLRPVREVVQPQVVREVVAYDCRPVLRPYGFYGRHGHRW